MKIVSDITMSMFLIIINLSLHHAVMYILLIEKKSVLPFTSDVFIGFPLRKAPRCLLAEKNCLIRGLYIIPISTFLFTSNATEMHVCGKRCTKFVVPSIGSIIHVGSLVSCGRRSSFATVSSPINLKDRI